jgi:peptide/nickel transport system substrate-binding protein
MKAGYSCLTFMRSLAAAVVCIAALTGGASATALAASPSPSASSPVAGLREPVLKVGFSYDIDGMNPLVNYSAFSWEVFRLNYNFLTWYDDNYRPVPELATHWETSPDGKVWTFTIRDDVKWHDGVPLTAKDVAFTYNAILDNQIYFYLSYVKDITKVEAPDDTTLVITSKRPNPLMLGLYIPILPEHLWGKIPGKKLETVKDPPTVGSGPFAISEVKK